MSLAGCGSEDRPPFLNDSRGASGSSRSGAGGEGGAGGAGGATPAGSPGQSGSNDAGGSGGAGGSTGGNDTPATCIPREGCQRLCGVLGNDPDCGLGNVTQCGCSCEDRFNGPCPDELSALLTCTGPTPAIDCSVNRRIFPGCEDESFALELCDFRAREELCAASYPECTPYCRGALLGFCSLGPESLSACLCGCEATLVTTCATEFAAFMVCTASAPTFTCDANGRPAASSCPNEWQALSSCMASAVDSEGK